MVAELVYELDDAEPVSDPLLEAALHAQEIVWQLDPALQAAALPVLLEYLLAHQGKPSRRPQSHGPLDTRGELSEFLAPLHVDSHPSRVTAIAYWHSHRYSHGVTTTDLVAAYAAVRAKRPQNYPDVIAACIRKGWLVEGLRRDGMKSWLPTVSGERTVEEWA